MPFWKSANPTSANFPASRRLKMFPRLQIWILAARPKTLWAALAPVAVGTAIAAREGHVRPGVTLAIAVAALLIQIGANLANDVFDFLKGADSGDRLGPPRVTERGLLTPQQVQRGMVMVFALAIAIGFYLAWVGGWPIVAIGLLSITAAIAYTGGPWPFGYHGLGDLMVFLFFGLVAVGGTVYLHADAWLLSSLWGAIPMGALATTILVVNNVRDLAADQQAGKQTLAVRLGRRGSEIEYALLLLTAYGTVGLHWWWAGGTLLLLLPLVSLPLAWRNFRALTTGNGAELNQTLARTAGLQALFGGLFVAGLLF